MKNFKTLLLLALFVSIFISCCQKNNDTVKIAISKAIPEESYINYINWLKKIDPSVEITEMYHTSIDSALILMEECDGLVLTGGTDVFPGKYGKDYDTVRCWPIDFKRDSLEFALIDYAINNQLPVLGICRGEQILNVSQGGSLYVHLPEDLDTVVTHRCEDPSACYHLVALSEGSVLHSLSEKTSGKVNSNHHQGIKDIADCFRPVAFTADGLIEAIQWKEQEGKAFLLGVQWHPERMDYNNPLSGKIGELFIENVKNRE